MLSRHTVAWQLLRRQPMCNRKYILLDWGALVPHHLAIYGTVIPACCGSAASVFLPFPLGHCCLLHSSEIFMLSIVFS